MLAFNIAGSKMTFPGPATVLNVVGIRCTDCPLITPSYQPESVRAHTQSSSGIS